MVFHEQYVSNAILHVWSLGLYVPFYKCVVFPSGLIGLRNYRFYIFLTGVVVVTYSLANTVKLVLSRPHIKRIPSIKWTLA